MTEVQIGTSSPGTALGLDPTASGRPSGKGLRGVVGRAASRLGYSLLVLWGAVTITFFAVHFAGDSVIDSIIGNNTMVTPAVRQRIIDEYGLGDSVGQQYLSYLDRLVHGDLGTSYQLQTSVARAIGAQLPSTLELMAAATLLVIVLTPGPALLTAGRKTWLRGPVSAVEVVAVAVPQFWLGILLLTVFSFKLHWFSVVGGGLSGLVLPAFTLALPLVGLLSQVLRQGLERTLDQPFVTTVRARGVRETTILLRHALRHAVAPVITMLGLVAASMTGGAVLVEQIYSRPGIGQMLVHAVIGKDIPVILGVVLVTAAFYLVTNLLVDVLYPLIDPRLRN